jgi:hypothetical protein
MAKPFLHHFRRQLQSAFAGNSDRPVALPVQLAFMVQFGLAAEGRNGGTRIHHGRLQDGAPRALRSGSASTGGAPPVSAAVGDDDG